jgi:uncharacterized protein DUF4352
MVPRIPDSSSDQSFFHRLWNRFSTLPRRVRFGLPAAALVLLGVALAFTASSSSSERAAPEGAVAKVGSPAASPGTGEGGAAKPAASPPPLAGLNSTATRPPFIVGEITPIPNRGITPTATPAAAKPGDPLRLGDYTVTLLEARDPVTSVYALVQPTQGNRFVAYQVQITNNSNRIVPYSYQHFRIRDSGGTELRSTASTTLEPALQTGNLAPRETITGWVTFMPRQDLSVEALYFQAPGMIGPRGEFSVR